MLHDSNQDVKTDVEKENTRQKCQGLECENHASENINMVMNICVCSSCAKKIKVKINGESLRRPALVGLIVFSITLIFWLMQSNSLTSEPSIFDTKGFNRLANHTHVNIAIERSFTDFIPFIQTGTKFLSIPDYATRVMGFIVLGLVLIYLRRKFERRFRH
jgi:hypothetical protein